MRKPGALLVPDPATYAQDKASADSARSLSIFSGLRSPFGPFASKTAYYAGLSAPGISSVETSQGWTPSDSNGAVGPGKYVEAVNSRIEVYNRAGLASVGFANLSNFVGRPTDTTVFDPVIRWDQTYGHWLFAMDLFDHVTGQPLLVFGISKTSDPNPDPTARNWCFGFLQHGTDEFEDYPKLGFNDTQIVLGTNVFSNSTDAFLTARIWTLSKPAIGAGSDCATVIPSIAVQHVGEVDAPLMSPTGGVAFTPEPAALGDSSSNGYVIAADWPGSGVASHLTVWKVSSTGAITVGGSMTVQPYSFPSNAPQPGTTNTLDTLDTRLLLAAGIKDPDAGSAPGNEAVWVSHSVAGTGVQSALQWYELLPELCSAGSCPTGAIRQSGRIQSGQGLWLWNSAIAPTRSGNSAVINYSSSSALARPQIRAQSRRPATPLNVLSGELIVSTSPVSDTDFTCTAPYGPACRWGDYSGASTDPAQDIVWGTNMSVVPAVGSGNPAHWSTRNFALSPSTSAVKISGSTIVYAAQPLANNNVTVTFGAGFYTFTEVASTLANTGGCVQLSVNSTKCPAAGITGITMTLLDRNDTVNYTSSGGVPLTLDTGVDDDTINVANGHGGDNVNCNAGTDTIVKDAGDTATNCETVTG